MSDGSEQYTAQYYSGNGQDGDRPALRLFTRLAKRYLRRGRVLDFGCGPGFFLTHLKAHFDACGVERSHWASAVARERTGVPIYNSLDSVPDASCDALVSIHVVEHIDDETLAIVLDQWRRVLKPGSRVLVVTPDAHGFAHRRKGREWIAFSDPTHTNLKSNLEWHGTFSRAGFTVVRSFADGLWDFPYLFPALGKLEVCLLGWPTLLQFLIARPLLRPGSGESVILILERDDQP